LRARVDLFDVTPVRSRSKLKRLRNRITLVVEEEDDANDGAAGEK